MSFLRRLNFLLRRRRAETEMAEEMRFHLEQRAALLQDEGLPAAEARLAAERRFGNTASLQEQSRDAWGWGALERFFKDVRFAARQLVRSPGFTLLAVVTLGLGIGVNTGVFNAFNSIIFKPLPYPQSGQVERFFRATPENPDGNFSPADFRDVQQAAARYGEVGAYQPGECSLSDPGQPAEMTSALRVSANLLPMLGLPLQHGRDFRASEELLGNDRVVILSHRLWQNRFGGRPEVVGRTLRIDGEPHEIIGVLPASLNDWRHLGFFDLFRPLGFDEERRADRRGSALRILGRRSPAVTPGQSNAFAADLGAQLARDFPAENANTTWRTVVLDDQMFGNNGGAIWPMLIGLSGFVLLIACSNLANLLLARTMSRAREFAVRGALGASRLQLLRPLVAESLLLALLGSGLAVLIAGWVGDWLSYRSTGDNGERVPIVLDWMVFLWAAGAGLVTALAFGLAPALFALRLDLNHTLKSGGRGATGSRGHQRFRQALIVGQFALAMTLLTGAALFMRGFDELNHRRSGWASEHLVSGSVLLPSATYRNGDRIAEFHRVALERLGALPGVASVSISAFTPYFNWPDSRRFLVDGQAAPPTGREPATAVNTVSPGYFDTVGTRLVAGRAFGERDTAGAPRVFIINQSLARALFGEADPLGRRLAFAGGPAPQWGEIVGVATDVTSVVPEKNNATFQLYQPLAQEPRLRAEIALRTASVRPSIVLESIRTTLAGLDPDLPIRNLKTADAAIERANYQQAVARDMLFWLAVFGLGLAALGIYGVIARTMAQRAGEFAIRLALGAGASDIIRLVLGTGLRQALLGAALGLLGGIGIARLLAASFTNMQLDRPLVVLGTTLLLIAVALLACWLPARRASRIDAIAALRAE